MKKAAQALIDWQRRKRAAFADCLRRAGAVFASPPVVVALLLLCGVGCAVAGVYLLAGAGWALIAGAVPLLLSGFILLRGLMANGE